MCIMSSMTTGNCHSERTVASKVLSVMS